MGRMDSDGIGSAMAIDSIESLQGRIVELVTERHTLLGEAVKSRQEIAQLQTELTARQREIDRLRHQASYRESSRSDSVEQEIKAWRCEVDDLVTAIRIIARRLK